jgi:segregation and condensation protein B
MVEPVEIPPPSLTARLEALLFVASEPVSAQQLAAAVQLPIQQVEQNLTLLNLELQPRGIRLSNHQGRYQLITAPEVSEEVELFLGLDATSRLSKAALETLAIIAYQQPVTRPQIDNIRGVNSDGVLRSLLNKGLIEEAGRAEGPGRPILYITTADFLQHFGLGSLEELPPLSLESTQNGEPDPDELSMLKD